MTNSNVSLSKMFGTMVGQTFALCRIYSRTHPSPLPEWMIGHMERIALGAIAQTPPRCLLEPFFRRRFVYWMRQKKEPRSSRLREVFQQSTFHEGCQTLQRNQIDPRLLNNPLHRRENVSSYLCEGFHQLETAGLLNSENTWDLLQIPQKKNVSRAIRLLGDASVLTQRHLKSLFLHSGYLKNLTQGLRSLSLGRILHHETAELLFRNPEMAHLLAYGLRVLEQANLASARHREALFLHLESNRDFLRSLEHLASSGLLNENNYARLTESFGHREVLIETLCWINGHYGIDQAILDQLYEHLPQLYGIISSIQILHREELFSPDYFQVFFKHANQSVSIYFLLKLLLDNDLLNQQNFSRIWMNLDLIPVIQDGCILLNQASLFTQEALDLFFQSKPWIPFLIKGMEILCVEQKLNHQNYQAISARPQFAEPIADAILCLLRHGLLDPEYRNALARNPENAWAIAYSLHLLNNAGLLDSEINQYILNSPNINNSFLGSIRILASEKLLHRSILLSLLEHSSSYEFFARIVTTLKRYQVLNETVLQWILKHRNRSESIAEILPLLESSKLIHQNNLTRLLENKKAAKHLKEIFKILHSANMLNQSHFDLILYPRRPSKIFLSALNWLQQHALLQKTTPDLERRAALKLLDALKIIFTVYDEGLLIRNIGSLLTVSSPSETMIALLEKLRNAFLLDLSVLEKIASQSRFIEELHLGVHRLEEYGALNQQSLNLLLQSPGEAEELAHLITLPLLELTISLPKKN